MSLKRRDLYHIIDLYNWDDGFFIPSTILDHPDCDLAVAMNIFYMADGTEFLMDKYINNINEEDYHSPDHWEFCSDLFQRMGDGKFKKDDKPIELSVGLKVLLLKNGVNNLLTNDMSSLMED